MELLRNGEGAHRLDGMMLAKRVEENLSACFAAGMAPAFPFGAHMIFPMAWAKEPAIDKAVRYKLDEAYWTIRKNLVAHGIAHESGTWEMKPARIADDGVAVTLTWTPRDMARAALERTPAEAPASKIAAT